MISFCVTRKCQKSKKKKKNDLKNFNKIFRKNVTYDNIESHKKTEFHSLFRRYIFRTNTGERDVKFTPTPAVLNQTLNPNN